MIRALFLFLLAGVTMAAVGWFATEPGRVVLDLRGWRIETSVGILVLAGVIGAAALLALWSVLHWLMGAPGRLRAWRASRRRARGLRALAAGMVAVAAGDAKGARKFARRAALAEGDTPLTLLLGAQSAQLEGDDRAAEKYFTEMLARPETEFLGLRGLVVQAQRAGDPARALAHAARAAKLRPDAGWAHATVFDLSVRSRAWAVAEDALVAAIRRGGIGRAEGARHRAALLLMQANDAEAAGFVVEALNLARRALRADGSSVPAALIRSRLEEGAGNHRRARRVLERAWQASTHPQVAAAYLGLATGEGEALTVERLRRAVKLLDIAPDAAEAHLLAAEAALDARLWGKAGKHLDDAEARFAAAAGDSGTRPARYFRLRARLAGDEASDHRAAARWLSEAAGASPDPRWVCRACAAPVAEWTGLCPSCGGFDTLEWRIPAPLTALAARPGSGPGPGPGPVAALGVSPTADSGFALKPDSA